MISHQMRRRKDWRIGGLEDWRIGGLEDWKFGRLPMSGAEGLEGLEAGGGEKREKRVWKAAYRKPMTKKGARKRGRAGWWGRLTRGLGSPLRLRKVPRVKVEVCQRAPRKSPWRQAGLKIETAAVRAVKSAGWRVK
jgi:hypothetical protein